MTEAVEPALYDRLCPGDRDRIMNAAQSALARRVDVLGTGPVDLGRPIDWHRDFKSGRFWPLLPFRRIDMLDLDRPSDIKVPWEISRLQWLIPLGQAYLLTQDEKYSLAVREIVEEWRCANPVARGVNWACAMEVALRAISLVWLFMIFRRASAWADEQFRVSFLRLLYVHADFTSRHLEWSDVNGNHLLADAAGLVVVGLFFERGRAPRRWHAEGWRILVSEIGKQVYEDGVDFEVSTAYQRLVMELYLIPALHRRSAGLAVDQDVSTALERMAEFVASYTRSDGTAPSWGDADDGRVLPFGGQALADHRYLLGLVARAAGKNSPLTGIAAESRPELFWFFGSPISDTEGRGPEPSHSRAFPQGGVYIMSGGDDRVFIDCGPVGFGGRGGHGHNDCLAFEACLMGERIFTDSGAYVYSASAEWRNRFRGTAFHNTPMIDGAEQNRFVDPRYLWTLRNDAVPTVRHWSTDSAKDIFVGSHEGYVRLAEPVMPVRGIMLDKQVHGLVVADRFEGRGEHHVSVPFHVAPEIFVDRASESLWRLKGKRNEFVLVVDSVGDWTCAIKEGWYSPSYGVKKLRTTIEFCRDGALVPLVIGVLPASAPGDPVAWLSNAVHMLTASAGWPPDPSTRTESSR